MRIETINAVPIRAWVRLGIRFVCALGFDMGRRDAFRVIRCDRFETSHGEAVAARPTPSQQISGTRLRNLFGGKLRRQVTKLDFLARE